MSVIESCGWAPFGWSKTEKSINSSHCTRVFDPQDLEPDFTVSIGTLVAPLDGILVNRENMSEYYTSCGWAPFGWTAQPLHMGKLIESCTDAVPMKDGEFDYTNSFWKSETHKQKHQEIMTVIRNQADAQVCEMQKISDNLMCTLKTSESDCNADPKCAFDATTWCKTTTTCQA